MRWQLSGKQCCSNIKKVNFCPIFMFEPKSEVANKSLLFHKTEYNWRKFLKRAQVWDFDLLDFNDFFIMRSL